MNSPIPEALLEMHYFHVVRNHFKTLLGVDDFHVFKPSTRRESWYGFDQGYFTSGKTRDEIAGELRNFLQSTYQTNQFTLRAYFLQFKVVNKLLRRSAAAPDGWSAPYYRSELSLDPNRETGLSQHETLMRATRISGAAVSYVCPMIFSTDDVNGEANFSDLRFVDVTSAPSGWLTTEKHHICFQSPFHQPVWKSKETEGRLLEFDDLYKAAEPFSLEGFESFLLEAEHVFQKSKLDMSKSNFLPSNMNVIATPNSD